MVDILIPPSALEAGARAFIGYGVDAAVWDHLGDAYKNQLQKEMSAAFLAMLTAWPGMYIGTDYLTADTQIKLPLPQQENSDE